MPVLLLGFRQHKYDLQAAGVLPESLNGAHEYRFPLDGEELLGYVAAHAQSLTTCYNNDIVQFFCFEV